MLDMEAAWTQQFNDMRQENATLRAEVATSNQALKDVEEEQKRKKDRPGIDTKLLTKPDPFNGKKDEWPSFALHTRAYLGAIIPLFHALLKRAEDPLQSIDAVDLDPEEVKLDQQMYYILTLLCKGKSQDKVALVDTGEGLSLWRSLAGEYEPQVKSRTMGLYQKVLNHPIGDDVLARLEGLERAIKQYETASRKKVDTDTEEGVFIRQMAQHQNSCGRSWGPRSA